MSTETEVMEPTAGVEETQPTAEAPAAPDATPSPPSPAGEEPAPTGTDTAASTRPRDPSTGRFVKADGSLASDAEQAAMEAVRPASPPPATTPTAPPVSTEPITFRGAGQKIPIPGSQVDGNGNWMIPADQTQGVRQLLAEGMEYRQTWRKKEQEFKQQIESASATERARAEKYNEASIYLFDILSDPAKLHALVQSPERIELVQERLQLMLQKRDLSAPKPITPPEQQVAPEVREQQMEQAARSTLDEYIEELLENPQARAVYNTPDKRQALKTRYQRRLNAYFAEHDGSVALHENAVDADFKEELEAQFAIQKAADDARKAAEFNARRNAPAPTLPPVVSTKAPPAATPAVSSAPQSREEWRRKNGLM